jgi:hypothetical protein
MPRKVRFASGVSNGRTKLKSLQLLNIVKSATETEGPSHSAKQTICAAFCFAPGPEQIAEYLNLDFASNRVRETKCQSFELATTADERTVSLQIILRTQAVAALARPSCRR